MDSELVLHPSRIYSLLGIYIQKSFFSNDKRGDEVFPLIDTYFIESFCTHHGITITDFTHFIQQKSIWNVRDSSLLYGNSGIHWHSIICSLKDGKF